MLKDALVITASSIIFITAWYIFVEPGLTHVRVNDIYKENLKSEILLERNLLTQRNNFTGRLKIIKEQEQITFRFENIEQDLLPPACPNVLVLLSLDFDTNNALVLGKLKGTEGNMNYMLPTGEDIKNYNGIMIWCKSFKTEYARTPIISPEDRPLFLR